MSVAKVTAAPTSRMSDLDSSLSSLFDNQSKGLARSFGGGGLLGLRGAVPKLPSFRVSLLASRKTVCKLTVTFSTLLHRLKQMAKFRVEAGRIVVIRSKVPLRSI